MHSSIFLGVINVSRDQVKRLTQSRSTPLATFNPYQQYHLITPETQEPNCSILRLLLFKLLSTRPHIIGIVPLYPNQPDGQFHCPYVLYKRWQMYLETSLSPCRFQ